MALSAPWRKAGLVAHVAGSVGWLGVVVASVVLGIVGMTSADADVVHAVYLVLEPLGWYALVPFSVLSLVTGLVQALGTRWGLLRHYWVLAKLAMNLFASGVLLLYMQTLTFLADTARDLGPNGDVSALRTPSPVVHAVAAVALLVTALMLSVYKPRGLTGYGATPRHSGSVVRCEAVREVGELDDRVVGEQEHL
jgi:hypothetical protein